MQSHRNMLSDLKSKQALENMRADVTVKLDMTAGRADVVKQKIRNNYADTLPRVDTGAGNLNLAWHPDGRTLAVGDMDDVVSVVDTRTLRIARAQSMPYTLFELGWSRDGARFFTSSGRGVVDVHDWPDLAAPVRSLPAHTSACFCLASDLSLIHI